MVALIALALTVISYGIYQRIILPFEERICKGPRGKELSNKY